tara:strand:- start:2457 stop:3191 length:735 start_codon:yes stop_codon:yes gene_type:complete
MFKKIFFFLIAIMIVTTLCIWVIPTFNTAFSIGTGIGLDRIQIKIERIQSKLINNETISPEEKDWLKHFYKTLAWGASMSVVLPESSRLMYHYLNNTGKNTSIDRTLFLNSPRVKDKMEEIRDKAIISCQLNKKYRSNKFEMGYGRPYDAVFALYFGTVTLERISKDKVKWTVEMPWKWPDYQDIHNTYGTYYKEIFPLPNMLAVTGLGEPLWVPNAIGGELENLGLAKSFNTLTTWEETFPCK